MGYNSGYNVYTKCLIDEVRISYTARSPDWILTEYRNQSAPATYLSVGPRLQANARVRHSVKTDQ
jgi:hypothetical protein